MSQPHRQCVREIAQDLGIHGITLGNGGRPDDCRERGLFPEQLDRWRQAALEAKARPLVTMAEQKALAEAAALL